MGRRQDIEAIFPVDSTLGAVPGTPEYDDFIDDQLTIVNADYNRSIKKLAEVADEVTAEVAPNTMGLVRGLFSNKPLRVLNICSGIGLTVTALMDLGLEIEHLVLTEQHPNLVERAATYLGDAGYRSRIGSLSTAVFEPNLQRLTETVSGEFDLVVSCNAFQHFSSEIQQRLIGDVYTRLSERGILVMQSHLKIFRPNWRESIIEDMAKQLRASEADSAFSERAFRHVKRFHNFVSTATLFEWFHNAGFSEVEWLFRRHIAGIVAGIK